MESDEGYLLKVAVFSYDLLRTFTYVCENLPFEGWWFTSSEGEFPPHI